MVYFEEYIKDANLAKTPNELFDIFINNVSQYGFDKVLFALITDHKDVNLSAGVGIMQNYPKDWMQYYHEKELDRVDPILTYGVHQSSAFKWDDIEKHVTLNSKQKLCLELGEEAGLNNGISVPLKGINNQMAGISLATSEKKDACYLDADLITAYCNHFYIAYKRLHEKNDVNPINIVITKKEKEILTWAAAGKSDDEIAIILDISKHTVNMHLRNIFSKMEVNNRVLAVVKALSTGLIQL